MPMPMSLPVESERLRKMDADEVACFRAVVATYATVYASRVRGLTPIEAATKAGETVGAAYIIDSIPKWPSVCRRFWDVESYALIFTESRLLGEAMPRYFSEQGV